MWWQAPAWAGKSALLSWFVLHPPQGTQVVSFFVTARYIGHDDRVAFVDLVLEQLAEMLGQQMPSFLTAANRETHLLGMLASAAGSCQSRGEQLVLVVDGLDEDRGVTTGPDAHSIAALLPRHPAAGLRVITSGRPDPPVPEDVPEDHPLRESAVVRILGRSRWAEVVQSDMKRELKRLLHGTSAEQDLLGLITAGGGGLSGRDLAELTGLPGSEIEEILHTVTGRTFTVRDSRYQLGGAPPVYVLGHEDLQGTSARFLGDARISGYRQRLHVWADGYRRQGWPTGTPEYLLRGYYRMLHAIPDMHRIVACAADQARHDRMLDITGGDSAAMAEIADAQNAMLRLEEPDLEAMAELAVHRKGITERNAKIPVSLPAVWTAIGHPARAEALARAIPDHDKQAEALSKLSEAAAVGGDMSRAAELASSITVPRWRALASNALARLAAASGDQDRAASLTEHAERLARDIADPHSRALALSGLAESAAEDGEMERAGALAREAEESTQVINRSPDLEEALSLVAGVIGRVGHPQRADELVGNIAGLEWRVKALTALARVAFEAGDLGRARMLAQRAEVLIRAWEYDGVPFSWAGALESLVMTVAEIDGLERAETVARGLAGQENVITLVALASAATDAGDLERAETLATAIDDPYSQGHALTALIGASVADGDLRRADRLLGNITNPQWQAEALSALAGAAAAAGDLERACTLAQQAETQARGIDEPIPRASMLGDLASALASVSEWEQAEALIGIIEEPYWQAKALCAMIAVASAASDVDRTQMLIDKTEAHVLGMDDMYWREQALKDLARATADAGDTERAKALARAIGDPYSRADALCPVVAAATSDLEQAWVIVCEAEALTQTIDDPYFRALALCALLTAIANLGDPLRVQKLTEQVRDIAHAIAEPYDRSSVLCSLAEAAISCGDLDRAEALICDIDHPGLHTVALSRLVRAVAGAGSPERAEALAYDIEDLYERTTALAILAEKAADGGNAPRVESLARQAEMVARSITNPFWQSRALAFVVETVACMGDLERAESLAGEIVTPEWNAEALAAIASNAEAKHARSLVARALILGDLKTSLYVLAHIHPAALTTIARLYLKTASAVAVVP